MKVITRELPFIKKYLTFDPKALNKKWIAVDDTTGDFWVEEFERIDKAIIWLNNKN